MSNSRIKILCVLDLHYNVVFVLNDTEISGTKRLITKGFESGTTLKYPIWSIVYNPAKTVLKRHFSDADGLPLVFSMIQVVIQKIIFARCGGIRSPESSKCEALESNPESRAWNPGVTFVEPVSLEFGFNDWGSGIHYSEAGNLKSEGHLDSFTYRR